MYLFTGWNLCSDTNVPLSIQGWDAVSNGSLYGCGSISQYRVSTLTIFT